MIMHKFVQINSAQFPILLCCFWNNMCSSVWKSLPNICVTKEWVQYGYRKCFNRECFAASLTFLNRYNNKEDQVLNHIMNGNEASIFHDTLSSKQQSMKWKRPIFLARQKFNRTISTGKISCIVFWYRKGIILADFTPRGIIINGLIVQY